MSTARGGLNDEEVSAEMNKMVAFIKQEALEKAREIKVKADEEFNIEKAKLVRQETMQIDTYYEKKRKQADVQKKIAMANHLNKNRLRLLQKRHEVYDDLLATCRTALKSKIETDPAGYRKALQGMVLQALLELMENDVVVIGRKEDYHALKTAAKDTAGDYEKMTKNKIKFAVSETDFLTSEDLGGCLVTASGGRIMCRNTMESRLAIAGEKMLPRIRMMLFGKSENRRFFD